MIFITTFLFCRSNTRYYGGYHGGHPTILWLWDIIMNDFTTAEKKLFLKVFLILSSSQEILYTDSAPLEVFFNNSKSIEAIL